MERYGIKKIGLIVADMERSLQFYHEIAGMPILERFPRKDGGENVFLNGESVILELMTAEKGQKPGALHHLAFGGSRELQRDAEHFRACGAEVTDAFTVEDDIHLADMEGPDGELVRLFYRDRYQGDIPEEADDGGDK